MGEALTSDALLALCRDQGDSKGTLKFFVSHASAPVHEPQVLASTAEYTMPPPVLPLSHTVSINPLRPKRRSRSRNGSFSSTSENLTPEVAAGYEADLDYPDREINKSAGRPPQHLIAPPVPILTTHQLSPRRHPSNHNRPSSPLIQNPEPVCSSQTPSDRSWFQRKEDKYPYALPAIPTPPQPPQQPSLSPNQPPSTSLDEPPILHNPTLHSRTASDADADRLSTLKTAENADNSTVPLRRHGPDTPFYGKSRLLESSRVNVNELQPSRRPYDDDETWEIVPSNLVQRHTDEQERVSPTISRHTARQAGISRYRPSPPYSTSRRHIMNNPPTRAPPAAPVAQETRTATQTRPARVPLSHQVFVTWKGEEGGNRKASPASVPSNGTRLGKYVTKSMDNLSFSPSSRRNQPQLPIARPSGTGREYSSSTITYSGIPKSYEPRSNFVRPLPVQGSSHATSPEVAQSSSIQTTSRNYSASSILQSQDPFPRPQSATGDPLISPTRTYTRPQYGPTLDSGEPDISPRTVSPHRAYHSSGIPGPRPQPTHHSDRSDRSSDIQSGPETTNSTPPRTPISPQSPRYDTTHGFDQLSPSSLSNFTSISGNSGSDTTVKQGDNVNFANLLDQMGQVDDKTQVAHTQPMIEKLSRKLTPSPPPVAQSAENSFGLDYEDDEDESDDGGGTWIRRPDPPKTSRPPLKVTIDSAVSQGSEHTMTSQDTPPASHLLNSTLASNQPPAASARPGSTFIDADGDCWAPRPPPENIYDRLDQFFSKHDLDKPVIEAVSGDTSPTTAEPAILPPNPVNDSKARIRGKKSIRIVVEEHKKRIDRTSMADPAAFANNILRKRNTKLWGSKLEELTTFRGSSTVSLPESPSTGPSKGIYLSCAILFVICLY